MDTSMPSSVETQYDVPQLTSPYTRPATNSKTLIDNIPRACKVCGDRAVGYNFGIVSCESCKAFFRRNACRSDDLICPFSSSCEINKLSRKFCQACRLQKCLTVGMKKEWLAGDKSSKSQKFTRHKRVASPFEANEDSDEGVKIVLSRYAYQKLVKQAETSKSNHSHSPPCSSKLTECKCKCKCGFYPQDTQLTAASTVITKPTPIPAPILSPKITDVSQQSQQQPFLPSPQALNPFLYKSVFPQPQTINFPQPNQATQPPSFYNQDLRNFPFLDPAAGAVNPLSNNWYSPDSASYLSTYMLSSLPNYRPPPPIPAVNSIFNTTSLREALQPNRTVITSPVDVCNSNSTLVELLEAPQNILRQDERLLLDELISANECLKRPMEVDGVDTVGPSGSQMNIVDVMRITNFALRRIITMAKQLTLFMELSQEDRISILKGSLSELLILRGVMVFDPNQDTWQHRILQGSQEIQLTVDILKQTPEEKHYSQHKKFLLSFDEKWRKNENVMLILNAITMFCADRPNIKNDAQVKRIQQRYYSLLKRYLETQCQTENEARQAYDSLLRKLVDLHELNQSLLRIYTYVDPNELDPFLQELFDLKTTTRP